MKKLVLASIVPLMFLLGCSSDHDDTPSGNFGAVTTATIYLSNNQTIPRAVSGHESGTDDENLVSWLEFYIFDDTGDVLDPAVGDGNGYLRLTTSSLIHKISLSAGTNKKILIAANMNIGAPASGANTFETIKAKMSDAMFSATLGTSDHNSRTVPSTGFGMSGTTTATIVAESTSNPVFVTINRLVSKVYPPTISTSIPVNLSLADIQYVWGDDTTVTTNDEITFTFGGYAVINGVTESTVSFVGNSINYYYDPYNFPWDTFGTRTHLVSSFTDDGQYLNNYSGEQNSSWFLDGSESGNGHRVYLYESAPTSTVLNGVSGYEVDSVIAYIIEGTLSVAGQTDVTRYWRVNLTSDDFFHIMRNVVYHVTINSISTPGYGTPLEAEDLLGIVPEPGETAGDFVINVAQWDINDYSTEM